MHAGTWEEENFRLLDVIRNSPLYPRLKNTDIHEFELIAGEPNTRVYRAGQITDPKDDKPIYVAIKYSIWHNTEVLALHELAAIIGLPIPMFAGAFRDFSRRNEYVTEDLTAGGNLTLFEKSRKEDGFPSRLANVKEVAEKYDRSAKLIAAQGYRADIGGIEFYRSFFTQIDDEGMGGLVIGDVTNLRALFHIGEQWGDENLDRRYREIVERIIKDERYFL